MAKRNDILDLGSWCILRMSSADTLPLTDSLTRAGLAVWTPVEKRVGRRPRSRSAYIKPVALMPSYVFAHVRHLGELAHIALAPVSDHPRFSIFKHQGGFPLIADGELDELRREESRKLGIFERLSRRGMKGPKLASGTIVRLPDGPFAGFSGTVTEVQGQFTLVDTAIFGKAVSLKVASLLLADNVIAQSDIAARAA